MGKKKEKLLYLKKISDLGEYMKKGLQFVILEIQNVHGGRGLGRCIYDLNVGGILIQDSVCNHAHHIGRRFSAAINTPNRKNLAIIWKAISCFHGIVINHCLVGFSDFQRNLVFGSNFLS